MIGDGRFELVFVCGNGYRTIRGSKIDFFEQGIYLGGQMDRPLDLEVLRHTKLFFIKLEPWTIGLLSSFDLKTALNETVPFGEINSALNRQLSNYDPESEMEKILLALSTSIEMAKLNRRDVNIVRTCCKAIDVGYIDFKNTRDHYLIECGLSSRTMEKKFSRYIGLTPKKYANGIRLRNISEELKYGSPLGNLSELAHKHGFYDQAHFIKYFKEYWGVIPKNIGQSDTFITNSKESFRYYTI